MAERRKLFNRKMFALLFIFLSSCVTVLYMNNNPVFIDPTVSQQVIAGAKSLIGLSERKEYIRILENVTEERFLELFKVNCSLPTQLFNIALNSTTILSLSDYTNYLATNFIRENANPFPKSRNPPKLETYEVSVQ